MSAAAASASEYEYELYIPSVLRKPKFNKETKKAEKSESGEPIYDKEGTEREIFWVLKQLNWGFITEVRVYGFEDKSKKHVGARISFRNMNKSSKQLMEALDAGETAQVTHPHGYWNVVKYRPRDPKVTVSYKIKEKEQRPQTPPVKQDFKPQVTVEKRQNKFKILETESDGEKSEGEKSD